VDMLFLCMSVRTCMSVRKKKSHLNSSSFADVFLDVFFFSGETGLDMT
jgi:hypothetical protein